MKISKQSSINHSIDQLKIPGSALSAAKDTSPRTDTSPRLTHLILASTLSLSHWVVSLKFIRDLNIQIALVLLIGLVVQNTLDLLALLHGEDLAQVEDGLLPVSVLGVWAGGETDGLVAGGEVNVEPGDQGVDEIVAADVEGEGESKGEVGGGAGVEIEGYDCVRVCYDSLDLDGVNEGFGEGGGFERGVVEAVDVVPD